MPTKRKANRTIIVSVINDLVTDQRVHKVCLSLQQAGYDVLLVGRKFRKSQKLERPYRTHRIRLIFNRSFFFYAEYNIRLFFYLLFSRATVFLSNDTDTLVSNYLVSKIRNKPLVFDAHELFPEVPEVVNRKFVKAFWTRVEDIIFPQLKYCYTVCQSIADIYNKKYNIQMQVVRNIPFAEFQQSTTPRIDSSGKQVLLYQGAVNVGRGIEWMIDAMPYLENYVFYVIGDGDILPEIKKRAEELNTQDRVIFLGRIPFEQLPAYTACADIGISLLENLGLNYYYSLPNRIFDFIRKNIPILATNFPEIRRVIAHYDVGTLIDCYEPQYLASVILEMTAKQKNERGFALANAELTWEKESETLLKIVDQAAQ